MVDNQSSSQTDSRSRSEPGREAQGRSPGGRVQDIAQQGADTLKNVASQAGEQIKETAKGVASSAQDIAQQGKQQAGEQVGAVANALHAAAGELEQEQPQIARVTHSLASHLDNARDYIERQGVRGIFNDLQDFARREPLMFLGGAVLVGLVASRFLKSSASRDDEDSHDDFGMPRGSNRHEIQSRTPLSTGGPVDTRPESDNPGKQGRMGGAI